MEHLDWVVIGLCRGGVISSSGYVAVGLCVCAWEVIEGFLAIDVSDCARKETCGPYV